MRTNPVFSIVFLVTLWCQAQADIQGISASEASANIGKTTTVCGKVASATFAAGSRGKPTFLNLDRPFPNHIFTAVIFDDYRSNFSYRPESLEGERICVTGLIESYRGKPQIKVRGPNQIDRQ